MTLFLHCSDGMAMWINEISKEKKKVCQYTDDANKRKRLCMQAV